mmetsp:Transcript_9/g.34  ORF Transcript_9/g.34 Transcript_9/m.34 type:complete len:200 (-) Transcript_9:555-1154(-)
MSSSWSLPMSVIIMSSTQELFPPRKTPQGALESQTSFEGSATGLWVCSTKFHRYKCHLKLQRRSSRHAPRKTSLLSPRGPTTQCSSAPTPKPVQHSKSPNTTMGRFQLAYHSNSSRNSSLANAYSASEICPRHMTPQETRNTLPDDNVASNPSCKENSRNNYASITCSQDTNSINRCTGYHQDGFSVRVSNSSSDWRRV